MFCPIVVFPSNFRSQLHFSPLSSSYVKIPYQSPTLGQLMDSRTIIAQTPGTEMKRALRMRSLASHMDLGIKYLLPIEVNALIEYLPSLDQKMFIRTLWNTGARISEALALTGRDFILTQEDEARVLKRRGASKTEAIKAVTNPLTFRDQTGIPLLAQIVPDSSYQSCIMIRSLKTHKTNKGKPSESTLKALNLSRRLVPLLDHQYISDMKEYRYSKLTGKDRLSLDEPFWSVRSRQTVLNWINEAVLRAEKDGIHFSIPISCHTFRHSYAIHLLNAGVPDRLLMEMLGHKSIKSLSVYTKIFALDRLSGIELSFEQENAAVLLKNLHLGEI